MPRETLFDILIGHAPVRLWQRRKRWEAWSVLCSVTRSRGQAGPLFRIRCSAFQVVCNSVFCFYQIRITSRAFAVALSWGLRVLSAVAFTIRGWRVWDENIIFNLSQS